MEASQRVCPVCGAPDLGDLRGEDRRGVPTAICKDCEAVVSIPPVFTLSNGIYYTTDLSIDIRAYLMRVLEEEPYDG